MKLKKKLIGAFFALSLLLPGTGFARTINGDLLVLGDLYGGLKSPGQMVNLNITDDTTTNTGDTITIECGGATCSATNPGWVIVDSAVTPGDFTVYKVTSDVSILITGAHWEIGGTGNISDAILRVNAVDHNGSLVWCLSYRGYDGDSVGTTLDSTTPSDINLNEEVLCSGDITSSTNLFTEVAWFRADFNDTGDIWAVQTDTSSIHNNQTADGQYQDWNPTYTGFSSNPTSQTSKFAQFGGVICAFYQVSGTATSNSTSTTLTLPIDAKHDQVFPMVGHANNGSALAPVGRVDTNASSNVLDAYTTGSGGAWTSSNGKRVNFNICYMATQANP